MGPCLTGVLSALSARLQLLRRPARFPDSYSIRVSRLPRLKMVKDWRDLVKHILKRNIQSLIDDNKQISGKYCT